jgi:hypothetical protein
MHQSRCQLKGMFLTSGGYSAIALTANPPGFAVQAGKDTSAGRLNGVIIQANRYYPLPESTAWLQETGHRYAGFHESFARDHGHVSGNFAAGGIDGPGFLQLDIHN